MQQRKPNDYVIATCKQYSVRRFTCVLQKLKIQILLERKGINEKCAIIKVKLLSNVVKIFDLWSKPIGNTTKTKKVKWKPKSKQLIDEMVEEDLNNFKKMILKKIKFFSKSGIS